MVVNRNATNSKESSVTHDFSTGYEAEIMHYAKRFLLASNNEVNGENTKMVIVTCSKLVVHMYIYCTHFPCLCF